MARAFGRKMARQHSVNLARRKDSPAVITVAKLRMNPPAPITDPDEEAAKRVLVAAMPKTFGFSKSEIIGATEQMRKEFAARKEAWEAGRS